MIAYFWEEKKKKMGKQLRRAYESGTNVKCNLNASCLIWQRVCFLQNQSIKKSTAIHFLSQQFWRKSKSFCTSAKIREYKYENTWSFPCTRLVQICSSQYKFCCGFRVSTTYLYIIIETRVDQNINRPTRYLKPKLLVWACTKIIIRIDNK